MSAFTGVSIADGNRRCFCETTAVDARGDSGYHLLMVKGYSRTKQLIPNGEGITAGPFNVGGHDWMMEYPTCAGFISLFLTFHYDADTDEGDPVEVRFSFSLVDQVEKQMPTYIRGTGETRDFSTATSIWGNDRFMRRDALEQSADLKCDCLTIRCDVVVLRNSKVDDDDAGGRGHDAKALLPDIHQHFNSLLLNKVGAGVAFQVGGETFPAHRCVLAARSKVFMAQLFGPMKEASNSVIQIKDMEPKVFMALLSFVYTDSFPDMYEDNIKLSEICKDTGPGQEDEMSEAVDQGLDREEAEDEMGLLQWLQGLFVAADRYDLQRLKFICVKQLSQRIGVSSVASTLALAEQHQCRGLKEACLKFIQVQSPPCLQTLMASSGWGTYCDHISLCFERGHCHACFEPEEVTFWIREAMQWRDLHYVWDVVIRHAHSWRQKLCKCKHKSLTAGPGILDLGPRRKGKRRIASDGLLGRNVMRSLYVPTSRPTRSLVENVIGTLPDSLMLTFALMLSGCRPLLMKKLPPTRDDISY